jgi:hypothetical protein
MQLSSSACNVRVQQSTLMPSLMNDNVWILKLLALPFSSSNSSLSTTEGPRKTISTDSIHHTPSGRCGSNRIPSTTLLAKRSGHEGLNAANRTRSHTAAFDDYDDGLVAESSK